MIRCGDITVKLDQKRAQIRGRDLGLTTKEYEVLQLLATRQGTPITKDMFLSHLYGGMDEPDQKIIDVYICKLRKKLMQAVRREGLHRDDLGQRLRSTEP